MPWNTGSEGVNLLTHCTARLIAKYKEFSWDVVINVVKIKLHRKSKEGYFNNDINDEISFLAILIT